ncbi:MAG: D-aminoacylase [Acidobacteriota bacterium]
MIRLAPLFLILACTPSGNLPQQASGSAGAERPATAVAPASPDTFNGRIADGEVIDGTGRPRFRADVGIRGDAIVAIGDLSAATSLVTIDAAGQVVSPGFIDLLGHSESSVILDPHLEGKIRQGVTTEVTGEGHSPGPLNDAMIAEANRTKPPGYPDVSWRSLDDFMRVVENQGSALNFAFYTGAANPREIAMGSADRPPTPSELKRMEQLIEETMRAGAVGMSTALIYPPGRFATTEELIAMQRVVAKYGGSYWTHLRSESATMNAALDEAFRIGRESKSPVNIFHLKTGGSMRGHMADVVRRIEAAQKSGLDVAASVYPYTATSTDLTSIVPAWALDGGYLQFVKRIKDPATRTRIAEELRIGDPAGILIRSVPGSTPLRQYERKRVSDIATAMGVAPAEAVLRLFEGANSSPIAIYFGLLEEDLKIAIKQPWVAVGSDSGAVVGAMREVGAHPRAYGTFPRILGHYVRDEHLFPLEEAVRKMTSLAASRVPIRDRGSLRTGMKADVVVFDPNTIRDVSTYEDPHHFSEGISNVIVNGKLVLRDGKMTAELPGRVLRRRP